MDEEKRANSCTDCGFSDHIEGAEYCQNCGSEIYYYNICSSNKCSARYDDDQDVTIPEDALYCPFCGEESLYLRIGILKPQNAQ